MMKVDLRPVVPVLFLLYMFAFPDRHVGQYRYPHGLRYEQGAETCRNTLQHRTLDLLHPLCCFRDTEVSSDYLLKRFRPWFWFPLCMSLFGAMPVTEGTVRVFSGLVAMRSSELFESRALPRCFYLISVWYKRGEAQRCITSFFASATLLGFWWIGRNCYWEEGSVGGYNVWRSTFIPQGLELHRLCSFLHLHF
ncbi:hypothetical protein BDM02DRAFT_2830177 [Thelephora ganbajun]|uniref:Uncharacterized protein n=1 Tax=Thelephora ganbajun TaxID=370292 RepID=A0ACB6ZCF9_THEGA|nr:hypothetical protein BDM02DRAFT_2830177 [Thelephora ganbajun]